MAAEDFLEASEISPTVAFGAGGVHRLGQEIGAFAGALCERIQLGGGLLRIAFQAEATELFQLLLADRGVVHLHHRDFVGASGL